MFEPLRNALLRFARVPAEPHPPLGAPGSIRVFRAGRNQYKLHLLRWGLGQVGAVIGILFSLWFLNLLDHEVADLRSRQTRTPARAAPAAAAVPASSAEKAAASADAPAAQVGPLRVSRSGKVTPQAGLVRTVARWPSWLFPLLHWLEYGAILLFVCQLPLTYAAVRLDYEQHWYIVTDRSLRIRSGLFSLTESTMSFANLQQVEVQQGPLQRLLGLANLRVQSAGGGERPTEHERDSLHTGVFRGVENAEEIRNLILERLRLFRQAGLGDPDDHGHGAVGTSTPTPAGDALAAARELLAEAKALRQAAAG